MNYIQSALNENNVDVNGYLKNLANKNADETQKEIDRLNELIDKSNEKIQRWQNAKLTADKYQKKALSALIQGEKEVLITNKILLSDEKEKQKEYLSTAKSYVEASEIINDARKNFASAMEEELDITETSYKIWLQNNEDTATKTQILTNESEMLNEKLRIQGEIVNATKIAYDEMVAKYGEAYSESKALYSALLDEVYAYNKIAESIENIYASTQNSKRESIFAMGEYLRNYKDALLESGFSEDEIYGIARKVSGYEAASTEDIASMPVKLTVDEGEIAKAAEEINVSLAAKIDASSSYETTGSEFAQALGDGFIEKFMDVSKLIVLSAESAAKDASASMQNAVSNTTTNYHFSTSAQTISQQIEDARRAEEMNKARGIT